MKHKDDQTEVCFEDKIQEGAIYQEKVHGSTFSLKPIYQVSKKAERQIFSTLWAKSVIFYTSLNKTSSTEENDTKIIQFGWVILILCPFLEIQSFSNFAWFLRPMSKELCREKPSIWCFVEAHWSVFLLLPRINGLPQNKWKSFPDTKLRSLVVKIKRNLKIDCISKSRHRFKITQPNLMILVSFFSAEDALSNDVKKDEIFSSQGTENPPFRFLGDTRYSFGKWWKWKISLIGFLHRVVKIEF